MSDTNIGPHPLASTDWPNRIGQIIGKPFSRRLGTWTPLHPSIEAPATGALAGALAGALWEGGNRLFNDDPRRNNSWKWPIGLGTAAGLGLGLMVKQNSWGAGDPMSRAISMLRRDPQLSRQESESIIQALRIAPAREKSRVLELAVVGGLTGVAASRILGLRPFASLTAGLVGANLYNRFTRRPTLV